MNAKKLFSDWIYAACFIMMLFFLIGYIVNLVIYTFAEKVSSQDILVAFIFFFGALFVFAMIIMVHRMFIAIMDKTELKRRLKQQELMSAISQSFTTTEDPHKLIYEALKMSGEFMNVNHSFLSKYNKEQNNLECLYEWFDGNATPFIGVKDKWPLTPGMQIYKDLTGKGYVSVRDYLLLTHHDFKTIKDYDLRAFLNISIYISGEFWGILGFIIYKTAYDWSESDINLGEVIAGVFSGVINRNMAEKELIRAKEMAEQGSLAKSEFLSRMSHEMRTPMNAIIGMTNIGKGSTDINRKNYCFGKIELASTHLLGVINDILDMSKIEANKLELYYTDFNLEDMLAKVVSVVGHQMEEKKQHFALSVGQDVPENINADEQRLIQVITNLIGNAVKFTPDEGAISVFVRKINENDGIYTLQFEVKDTGIGITKEQQARLFTSFEQADGSISRDYGGTGLGLAISKRIVEMMNGNIRIESVPNQGTSFIFDIMASGIAQKKDVFSSRKHTPKNFKGKKILIAEDIAINREIVAALLESTGVAIDFAENGRMAYDMFSADPSAYAMIFMDVHMPKLNGYETTRMIRNLDNPRAKTVPIIAMTADVFREDIEKSLASGMNAHVGKPLNAAEVIAKLEQYMSADNV
ncbi:MAG: ATP-binding protein [Endomicrobia bacterium]|nr:ATP-binding protein [Endomicrobiia bacterium]MCL2800059.1 ATP-binding protein [Endomicrobiia bacterium]